MPANYFGSNTFGYNVKENITSIIAWINIYNIGLLVFVFLYIIAFEVTGLTGFFTSAPFQVLSLPFVAWHLPTMIATVIGFIFSQDANELFALPLTAINLIGFLCYFISLIISFNGIATCVQSSTITCGFVDVFALTLAIVMFGVGTLLELLLVFSYIRYSVYINNFVEGLINEAKMERENAKYETNQQNEEVEMSTNNEYDEETNQRSSAARKKK